MKVLITFFSYTGNTRKVAETLATFLAGKAEVEVEEIRPIKRYPYLYWLMLSFIPCLGTLITPPKADPRQYDVVCLGLPKWTFGCPPINQYLKEVNLTGKTIGLFITYGGFDERRYLKHMIKHLSKKGANVKAFILLKRRWIEEDKVGDYIRSFCNSLFES